MTHSGRKEQRGHQRGDAVRCGHLHRSCPEPRLDPIKLKMVTNNRNPQPDQKPRPLRPHRCLSQHQAAHHHTGFVTPRKGKVTPRVPGGTKSSPGIVRFMRAMLVVKASCPLLMRCDNANHFCKESFSAAAQQNASETSPQRWQWYLG